MTDEKSKWKTRLSSFLKSALNKLEEKLNQLRLPQILKNPKIFLGSAALIILIVIITVSSFSTSANNVPTYTVKKENFQVSITESGEIRAKNSTSVTTPRVPGSLKIVYMVPEGNYIQAGDVVVKFDPTEAMINLKNAESKLDITESDRAKMLADQKSSLTNLESNLKSAELSFELS